MEDIVGGFSFVGVYVRQTCVKSQSRRMKGKSSRTSDLQSDIIPADRGPIMTLSLRIFPWWLAFLSTQPKGSAMYTKTPADSTSSRKIAWTVRVIARSGKY